MRILVWSLAACAVATTMVSASHEDRVTVSIDPVGEQEIHVLKVDEVVQGENPRVKVRAGKVRIKDGEFVSNLNLSGDDRIALARLTRDDSVIFRLCRGMQEVGIYTYRVMPKDGRPDGRGIWLEALPLDKDDTFRELTREAREGADIEKLVELDIEAATEAARREEALDRKISDAIAREWKRLSDDEYFFIPTQRR